MIPPLAALNLFPLSLGILLRKMVIRVRIRVNMRGRARVGVSFLSFQFPVEVIVFRSLGVGVVNLGIGGLGFVGVMRGCLCFVRVKGRCLCLCLSLREFLLVLVLVLVSLFFGDFLLVLVLVSLFFREVIGSGRRWRRIEIFPVPNRGGLGRGGGVCRMRGGEKVRRKIRHLASRRGGGARVGENMGELRMQLLAAARLDGGEFRRQGRVEGWWRVVAVVVVVVAGW